MAATSLLADLVLVAHAGVVAFVVLGQALVMLGGVRGWRWVRNPVLRIAHLGLMLLVAAQAWLGVVCPLTTLEQALRAAAGEPTHDRSFIAYWLGRLIFYDAPGWVFVAAYTGFALLVVASWLRWPPRRARARRGAVIRV